MEYIGELKTIAKMSSNDYINYDKCISNARASGLAIKG